MFLISSVLGEAECGGARSGPWPSPSGTAGVCERGRQSWGSTSIKTEKINKMLGRNVTLKHHKSQGCPTSFEKQGIFKHPLCWSRQFSQSKKYRRCVVKLCEYQGEFPKAPNPVYGWASLFNVPCFCWAHATPFHSKFELTAIPQRERESLHQDQVCSCCMKKHDVGC